jgi:hypothetical protein
VRGWDLLGRFCCRGWAARGRADSRSIAGRQADIAAKQAGSSAAQQLAGRHGSRRHLAMPTKQLLVRRPGLRSYRQLVAGGSPPLLPACLPFSDPPAGSARGTPTSCS